MTDDTSLEEQFLKEVHRIIVTETANYCIVIKDADYAQYLEYGRKGPVTKRTSDEPLVEDMDINGEITKDDKGKPVKVTKARNNIRNWVQKKYGYMGAERIKHGDRMYKKLMNESIPPHPFIRPAIMSACMNPNDVIEQGKDYDDFSEAFAQYIAKEMRNNLKRNGSIVSENLYNGIEVVPTSSLSSDEDRFEFLE